MKTLIAYESKSGATEGSAQKIAETLRTKYNLDVDLVDLKEQKVPDLTQYQNIVLGGGVRVGKVYSRVLKFLERDVSGKKVAFFVSSGQAGEPNGHDDAKVRFVEGTLANYPNVKPLSTEAFGGKMKILGKTIFNNIDFAKVEAWAGELGKKFTQ